MRYNKLISVTLLCVMFGSNVARASELPLSEVNSMTLETESGLVINGKYFDKEGNVYASTESIDYTEVVTECIDKLNILDNGGTIYINNVNEGKELLFTYFCKYNKKNVNSMYYLSPDGNSTLLRVSELPDYSRQEAVNAVISKFGKLQGESDLDKVLYGCQIISDTMNYDMAYIKEDMIKSMEDEVGVCWQYACILQILLEDSGIQSETVLGYTNTRHMWVKSYVDGRWVYSDPTLFQDNWYGFYDIDYTTYLMSYTEASHNDWFEGE